VNCSRCKKDITNNVYKIAFRDEVLCVLCYRKIPYSERINAIKEG
jgi:hypothetical protein